MKLIQKYLYWGIATLAFAAIVAVGFLKSGDLPRFYITSDSHTEVISTYNAQDGNYYVFLPSYAELKDVIIDVPYFQPVTLNGSRLTNGMDCSGFSLEMPYELHYKRTTATLWFYRSANVATMYINTSSGNMDAIHENKDHEEAALVSLYTADGSADCVQLYSTLKGRGNSSWEYNKRPYTLTLSAEKDMLDMGSATNWVLLANACDETNLNNKLILDLAADVGLPWTPESHWVDLYLNGEYSGLYLLAEKVEVLENRLDIRTGSTDFLCKIDLSNRWATLRNPFVTEAGRTVEINFPKILTAAEMDTVQYRVNQMEQTLLSGEALDTAPSIDLDSWIRRYLIDEISGNIDADHASSYFYYSDGVFFAGPVWDYDIALGNDIRNQDPCAFLAKTPYRSVEFPSPYYSALYSNASFYNRMVEIYRMEFVPLLQQMLDSEIDELSVFIGKAAASNSLRWRTMFDALQSGYPLTGHTTAERKQYLSRRMDFLNDAWLNNTEYCTVQFEPYPGSSYQNVSVKKGSCMETEYIDILSAVWIDTATGKAFDFRQPIMADTVLSRQVDEAANSGEFPATSLEEPPASSKYITLLSIAVFIILLVGLWTADTVHRHKERRHSGEPSRTKVSP